MSASERRDPSNLISRFNDSDEDITPSDIVRIFIGYYDKESGQFVDGFIQRVNALEDMIIENKKEFMASQARDRIVEKYLLYFLGIMVVLRFFGIDHLSDIIRLTHGGA